MTDPVEDFRAPAVRSAVVTGAASGMGEATTRRLLSQGWSVVAADLNDAALGRLVGELGGERLVPVVVDVAVEADVANAIECAVETFGRCSAVVNNAGVGGAFGAITAIEAEDWDYTFDVMARGVFFGVKHGARAMMACGGGSIVNVSSVAAFFAGAGPAPYSAAKAAVVSLTQTAALELAGHHIRVNSVAPGVVRTPLLEHSLSEEARQDVPSNQPWREWGGPNDIAAAICFLLSDEATFITGQTIKVDGGLSSVGPGVGLARALGTDARHLGVVGVNKGSTGQKSVVRGRTS